MQPTMEILERLKENSKAQKDEVFTRLYRYLLRPDLYYIAYKKLYANNGASTKGVNDDTADGFSEDKVKQIIARLADETYTPSPVRRTYIPKANGKMRPLGIPTFTDKLVQEVLRMVLEAIYEPVFHGCSHGFRPERSCHTALNAIKYQFTGTRWFIEGDIKSCFDNISHTALLEIVGSKIKDARFIKLICKFLKSGYLEDWKYNNTYSGTPQGGIISPLLANIYLHALDDFVLKMASEFEKPRDRKYTPAYGKLAARWDTIREKLKTATGEQKELLLAERKHVHAVLLTTPCKPQTDKKIKYVRYADDFLIGVNGSKEDCQKIKEKLTAFIKDVLKMELSDEKTLITHSNQYARFLGYDVRVRHDGTIKTGPSGRKSRSLNGSVELNIPLADKINKFLLNNHVVEIENGEMKPTKRTSLLRLTEFEIVSTYNAELRGLCNYYHMASNFCHLNYFAYLMEYSCLKTLAAKRRSTIGKVKEGYKDGKGKWGIPYESKQGSKRLYFAEYTESKNVRNPRDHITHAADMNRINVTSFESRLNAKVCELCGTTESQHYEVHHVNKLKNLQGKAQWEIVMIAKRRKTMVLCRECHNKIHNQ